ncbi:hypothetical protein V1281_000440 [Nitrobacteraceae bacterium AZCC 2161]
MRFRSASNWRREREVHSAKGYDSRRSYTLDRFTLYRIRVIFARRYNFSRFDPFPHLSERYHTCFDDLPSTVHAVSVPASTSSHIEPQIALTASPSPGRLSSFGDRRAYVKQVLVPTLRKNDIVFMDNLRTHRIDGVAVAIVAAGAKVRYLPRIHEQIDCGLSDTPAAVPVGPVRMVETVVDKSPLPRRAAPNAPRPRIPCRK